MNLFLSILIWVGFLGSGAYGGYLWSQNVETQHGKNVFMHLTWQDIMLMALGSMFGPFCLIMSLAEIYLAKHSHK